MNRRTLIQTMAGGAAVNLAGLLSQSPLRAQPNPQEAQARRGLPPLKITNVKAILTAPPRIRARRAYHHPRRARMHPLAILGELHETGG